MTRASRSSKAQRQTQRQGKKRKGGGKKDPIVAAAEKIAEENGGGCIEEITHCLRELEGFGFLSYPMMMATLSGKKMRELCGGDKKTKTVFKSCGLLPKEVQHKSSLTT
ncbi:hypothetical protein ES702_03154 [subsurface metagenome]